MNWSTKSSGVRIVFRVVEILEELKKYLPMTLRQIHYQLVARNVQGYENSPNKYKQLSRWLYEARVDGIIPWNAMVDRGRPYSDLSGYRDAVSFLKDFLLFLERNYTRDYMQSQPRRLEIWTEKDALASVLARFASPYGVSIQTCRGFGSGSQFYDVVKRNDRKPLHILYFGDHDPSGLWMSERDIQSRLQDKHDFTVTMERIALNRGQVQNYNLAEDWQPPKPKDTRSKWYIENYGYQCWELDALPPDILGSLVSQAIESNTDMELFNAEREKEESDLSTITELKDEWWSQVKTL